MRHIISIKYEKKLAKKRKHKQWWFKHTVYKKVKKTIAKYLYNYRYHTATNTNQIFMLPEDFKKYSNQQIEFALDMLLHDGELERWEPKTIKNQDGYLLIIAAQNRSQARFSSQYLQEIDLNDVQLEPITNKDKTGQNETKQVNSAQEQATVTTTEPTTEQVEPTPKHKNIWDD